MDKELMKYVVKLDELTTGLDIDTRSKVLDLYPTFIDGLIQCEVFGPKPIRIGLGQGAGTTPGNRDVAVIKGPSPVLPQPKSQTTIHCPHCGQKVVLGLEVKT